MEPIVSILTFVVWFQDFVKCVERAASAIAWPARGSQSSRRLPDDRISSGLSWGRVVGQGCLVARSLSLWCSVRRRASVSRPSCMPLLTRASRKRQCAVCGLVRHWRMQARPARHHDIRPHQLSKPVSNRAPSADRQAERGSQNQTSIRKSCVWRIGRL